MYGKVMNSDQIVTYIPYLYNTTADVDMTFIMKFLECELSVLLIRFTNNGKCKSRNCTDSVVVFTVFPMKKVN